MRRKEREVKEFSEILDIIARCPVIRLGMVDNGKPYIVPLNFGYKAEGEALTFYFHSARDGRKIDILRKSPQVCFEMDCDPAFKTHESDPCAWTMYYESIMGEGEVSFLESEEEKREALTLLMGHSGYKGPMEFHPGHLKAVAAFQLKVTALTAKGNLPKKV